MDVLPVVYGLAAACVVYPYVGYPLILAARARWRVRPVRRGGAGVPRSVSVVLALHNEVATVERRVLEFTERIAAEGLVGEVVVVSDGSTDDTVAVARRLAARSGSVPVQVIDLAENVGKAAAVSTGCAAARHEVIVLADARQTWASDTLRRLLENFADPEVGAVSGELVVESAPGVMGGVGLYWKIEKWLRRKEGLVHSTVGLTGAVCAVRRELFRPVPAGTILDDVYWPALVVQGGHRVVFDERALAYDRLPDRVQAEFRRKVRTLSGNFQLVARLPGLLVPWRNPLWFTLVSHKLMRLVVPWAVLVMLVVAAGRGGPIFGTLLGLQLAAMLVALAGLLPAVAARSRLAATGASFLVLNAAAWLAFWVWASGRAALSWTKTTYQAPVAVPVAAEARLEGVVR